MVVKTGRLYLWNNDISSKELVIKVGTAAGASEYVEIDDIDLAEEYTGATITLTNEENYNLWVADPDANSGVWLNSITDISNYIFDDDRKIIIYVMIDTDVAFEMGEMGIFTVEPEETYNDWVGQDVPITEPTSGMVSGDMWYDVDNNLLHTYTTTWDAGVTPSTTTQPLNPSLTDTWFDDANFVYYTYTENVVHPAYNVMITRNLMSKQFISTTEIKVIKYTINI